MNENADRDDVATFPFWLEEQCIADELVACVRKLLHRPDLTPAQIRDLAVVLLALEALPLPVDGADVWVTLKHYHDSGTSYISLHLSDTVFTLESGGYSRSEFGGDSYGSEALEMEIGGYRSNEAPAWLEVSGWMENFKNSVLDSSFELEISNEGDLPKLDWEVETDESAWESVRSYE